MKRLMIACVSVVAFAVPALAGGSNGANSHAAPIGALYSSLPPRTVGQVLPSIVQSYTPSKSPLNVLPASNSDDLESYGQALQESQPGAPNGWTCSSGC